MSDENEVTAQAFWEAVHSRPTIIGPRTSASTEPPAPAELPEPEGPTAEDIPLADWAANRAALGIRDQGSDFLGLSSDDDDGSGFPSWRTPVVEQIEFSEMDRYAEERAAAGIRNASDVFGVDAPQPRVNASAWQAFVQQ